MTIRGYYLGCPAWGMKTWVGRLFPAGTKQADFLPLYSRVFNTVEGNTTFYALPKADTVKRWGEEVPDDFRFCFKFPKKISHEKMLLESADYVAGFVERVAPLGPKLGTLMLQLPPRFGFKQLERLRTFFNGAEEERQAAEMLAELGVDTVTMDARGLHATDAPELAEVRERKPNLPIVMRATGPRPIVRCVPHERFDETIVFVKPWLDQLAKWMAEGKTPYFFMHAPDDTFAPENAYRFHAMLRERVDVGDLPPWPGQTKQASLF
jgi:uncharacterized protein YecE (DUF72 family)